MDPEGNRPKEELLLAAEQLLASAPPSAISGRTIAQTAGVNYGLLHRYFGTKEQCIHEAFDRLVIAFEADAFDGSDSTLATGELRHHPHFWRALTHIALDTASFGAYQPRTPVIERHRDAVAVNLRGRSQVVVDTHVALSVSVRLGVLVYWPTLSKALGLTEDDVDVCHEVSHSVEQQMDNGEGLFDPAGVEPRPIERRAVETLPDPPIGHGREIVEQRLVLAGARLLESQSPTAISGRELAAAAEVNYGSIHHYFGSADEVLRQSFQLHRSMFYEVERSGRRPPDYFSVSQHPGYVRAVTWQALDPKFATPSGEFPVAVSLIRGLEQNGAHIDARVRSLVLSLMSLQLGWALFRPIINTSLQREIRELEPLAAAYLARAAASVGVADIRREVTGADSRA